MPRFPAIPAETDMGLSTRADPKWTAREIDLAADHGIDVFLRLVLVQRREDHMQEAWSRGFFAGESDRMKFALDVGQP